MKIRFTKSIIKEIAKLAENFVFAGVKEDVILDMEGLCQTVDMYRELHLKGQKYEGQPGKITINVPDELFPVMISTYGFRMVKESELDMATVGELCDIYKQLKSGSSEQIEEEDSAVEESSVEESPADPAEDESVEEDDTTDAEEDFADTDSEDTAEDATDATEDTDPVEESPADSDEDVADIGEIMPQPETEASSEEPEFDGLSEEDQAFFAQLAEDSLFR